MSPALRGVAETALYVDDLAAARPFYETILGLPVAHATDRAVVFSMGGGQVLIVFSYEAVFEARRTPGGTVPAVSEGPIPGRMRGHVAFRVSGDDLGAWRDQLAHHGIPV